MLLMLLAKDIFASIHKFDSWLIHKQGRNTEGQFSKKHSTALPTRIRIYLCLVVASTMVTTTKICLSSHDAHNAIQRWARRLLDTLYQHITKNLHL